MKVCTTKLSNGRECERDALWKHGCYLHDKATRLETPMTYFASSRKGPIEVTIRA